MDQMIQIDEGRMKDIFTADQEGQSAKEIAKALKLPLGTVKKILGEEEELKEFTASQLDILAKQYAGMSGKTISVDQANKLRKIFKQVPDSAMDALRKKKIPFLSGLALSRMVQKGMPVKESNLDTDNVDKEKDTSKEKELKIKLDKEKDQDALEKQLVTAQGQINILKQKLENEKNKAVKPEPNKDTGEVPLTVGVAHKYLKDKQEKEQEKKEVKKEETIVEFKKMTVSFKTHDMMSKASTDLAKQGFTISGTMKALKVDGKGADLNKYATDLKNNYGATIVAEENLKEADPITYGPDKVAKAMKIAVKSDGMYSKAVREIEKIAKDLSKVSTIARALKTANEDRHAGAKAVYEQIKGLKNKAEKTGMPYGILKKVYDRGMAAWRGGHRPGTTQQQWAFARVNSFVTKSSGTWGGADKDLAKQVKG